MHKIVNRRALEIENKDSDSLSYALSALEAALSSVDPALLVKKHVKLKDTNLLFSDIYGNTTRIGLSAIGHIFVVGAGKASGKMASAICEILGKKIYKGAINIPYDSGKRSDPILLNEAGHPFPDRNGLIGTEKILSLLNETTSSDLVIVLISGGGSALLPMPTKGISLSAKQLITQSLLFSGASINELNVVRKHLSAVKGGQLLNHIGTGCRAVSIIISDVIGDDLGIIASGPTFPDISTFLQAKEILKKYILWDSNKKDIVTVRQTIQKGINGVIKETIKPGDKVLANVSNLIIGNNEIACYAAVKRLKKNNVTTIYLGSYFGGFAVDHGKYLANLANQFSTNCLPSAFVLGGETVVKLDENHQSGTGGRNQEAALSSAISFKYKKNMDLTICCLGTDGIDGNSINAGAAVTSRIFRVVFSDRQKYQDYLARHDSSNALDELKSLIITGRTGTNVNDVSVIVRAR